MNILIDSIENQLKVAKKINDGEIVILPSNGVYTLNTNIFNTNAIEKIYLLKQREMSSPMGVAVKDLKMAESLMDKASMSANECKIIETLIQNFWPGMLTIVVKTHLKNRLFTHNSYISLESPCHETVQNILSEIEKPIITTSANINKLVSCTHISHVKNYFSKIDLITTLSAQKNPKYGIEATILKIEDNNLSILRVGTITKKNIEDALLDSHLDYNIQYSQTDIHGTHSTHYAINKNCIITNFATNSRLDKRINEYTLKYLNSVVLVDFGKKKY